MCHEKPVGSSQQSTSTALPHLVYGHLGAEHQHGRQEHWWVESVPEACYQVLVQLLLQAPQCEDVMVVLPEG